MDTHITTAKGGNIRPKVVIRAMALISLICSLNFTVNRSNVTVTRFLSEDATADNDDDDDDDNDEIGGEDGDDDVVVVNILVLGEMGDNIAPSSVSTISMGRCRGCIRLDVTILPRDEAKEVTLILMLLPLFCSDNAA